MSQRVQDLYDEEEFEGLLDNARMNAANDWEESFVADMKRALGVQAPHVHQRRAEGAPRTYRQRRVEMDHMNLDISKTIAPKSEQLNADDLIAGPRTITVTSVKIVAEDQPVAIHFAGDEGKPYKPCKSMRRVLVRAWGATGRNYVGKSMTLFLDEQVRFGGAAVGGIRISHLSHIESRSRWP